MLITWNLAVPIAVFLSIALPVALVGIQQTVCVHAASAQGELTSNKIVWLLKFLRDKAPDSDTYTAVDIPDNLAVALRMEASPLLALCVMLASCAT